MCLRLIPDHCCLKLGCVHNQLDARYCIAWKATRKKHLQGSCTNRTPEGYRSEGFQRNSDEKSVFFVPPIVWFFDYLKLYSFLFRFFRNFHNPLFSSWLPLVTVMFGPYALHFLIKSLYMDHTDHILMVKFCTWVTRTLSFWKRIFYMDPQSD